MNKDTNKWAVEVNSPELSEAVQRIAFSFGYGWPVDKGQKVNLVTAPYLAFDPDNKRILYAKTREETCRNVNRIVNTFDDVVNLFKNPPKVEKSYVKVFNDTTVHRDGSVLFKAYNQSVAVSSDQMDHVITVRNKLMGKEEKIKLMKVRFVYTSSSSGRKFRTVLVMASEDGNIEGLDVDDGYRYKKFLIEKITGEIVFLGFADKP